MNVFAVLLQETQPRLVARITTEFPGEFLRISDTQFLIAARGVTAIDISRKLGITFEAGQPETDWNNGIILSIPAFGTYHGRADPNIWTWIKTRLEAS